MFGFNRKMIVAVVLALVICPVAVLAQAAQSGDKVDPVAVQAAIKKGVEYLYSMQGADGSWEVVPQPEAKGEPHSIKAGQWGGQTALATYALLAAGESPQNPKLAKAIQWLQKADMEGIYAVGMRAQVWTYLPKTPETFGMARRDWLIFAAGVRKDIKKNGFGTYDYLASTKSLDRVDLSVSQYGVLGAWACAQVGIEIPVSFWNATDTAWQRWQKDAGTGGWAYTGKPDDNHPVNLPITAAGVATLFIVQDYTRSNEGLRCGGNIGNPNIEAGLKYIQSNIDGLLKSDGKKNKNIYYTLYGIERIGVASGLKYFGTIDWYQTGAKWLLEKQNKSKGSWSESKESGAGGGFCDNTFALIFLSRGSAPVAINKLQYDLEGEKDVHWTQRPRDAANLTHWMGRQIERSLNWQIVNLKVAVMDLHDAPILFIAGDQKLKFSAQDEAKLKEYVEQGGLIVGNADCSDKNFQSSFRDLGKKLFNTEFRELPDNHPIYNLHFKRDGLRKKPRWQGISNGARELMVLIGDDASRSWQSQSFGGNEGDFQMMLNLFKYSVDSEGMAEKGKTHIVTADPKATAKQTIKIARGEYNGAWNPEPGGWNRLSAVMLNENGMKLDVSTVKLDSGTIAADVKVLHITGTGAMNLSEAAQDAIRKFVAGGGTLMIDAAGGNSEFVNSADQLLAALWPIEAKQLDEPMKVDHALFGASGKKQTEFRYRGGVRAQAGLRAPNIRAITINDRPAVLYSREDLSVGLVGMPIAGVAGYDPDSATQLMKNVLMYVSKR